MAPNRIGSARNCSKNDKANYAYTSTGRPNQDLSQGICQPNSCQEPIPVNSYEDIGVRHLEFRQTKSYRNQFPNWLRKAPKSRSSAGDTSSPASESYSPVESAERCTNNGNAIEAASHCDEALFGFDGALSDNSETFKRQISHAQQHLLQGLQHSFEATLHYPKLATQTSQDKQKRISNRLDPVSQDSWRTTSTYPVAGGNKTNFGWRDQVRYVHLFSSIAGRTPWVS